MHPTDSHPKLDRSNARQVMLKVQSRVNFTVGRLALITMNRPLPRKTWRIMRYVIAVFAVLVVSACTTPPTNRNEAPAVATSEPPNTSQDPVEFLLASAVADFHKYGPAGPLRFRNLRVGQFNDPKGGSRHMLCGEYQITKEGPDSEWTSFATIKTSGYEQWNGSQADGFCKAASVKWDSGGDLSSSLQNRFDSMK